MKRKQSKKIVKSKKKTYNRRFKGAGKLSRRNSKKLKQSKKKSRKQSRKQLRKRINKNGGGEYGLTYKKCADNLNKINRMSCKKKTLFGFGSETFQGHVSSTEHLKKIFKEYKDNCKCILSDNPYYY